MLRIDLHLHTADSLCAIHSHLEVMKIARNLQCEMIAITDHGPSQKGTTRGTFYHPERTPRDFEGMTVLKGMEVNVLNTEGETDTPERLIPWLDIVLAGLHPTAAPPTDAETHTAMMTAMMRGAMPIDIVTHQDQKAYPLDIDEIVTVAAEEGVALEINNTGLFLGKSDIPRLKRMIELGHKRGAMFSINSDGHTWAEMGRDETARKFLEDMGAPALDIINDWPMDKLLERLEARKRERCGDEAARIAISA